MIKNIIIFCSAPADIQYVLSIYEENLENAQFYILVEHVYNIYKFVADLKLKNAKVEFIPYPNYNIKNPFSIIRARNYINNVIKKYVRNIIDSEVYYFSNNYDLLRFACMADLSKRNKLFCFDHYKISLYKKERPLPIKHLLILLIYSYLTRASCHFEWIKDRWIICFNSDRYGIVKKEIRVSKEIYVKYAYHVKRNQFEKSILFFESIDDDSYIVNYREALGKIIDYVLEAGFAIYIKPHPRTGHSKFLEEYGGVRILPEYIPGEFIFLKDFSAIIGILTVSIAKIACISDIPAYSLMDLFTFNNISQKEVYRKYLIDQSDGKVKFVDNIRDISADG